ncbi:MAG: hypothetical protein HQ517_11390 [SAR324 cluster bacterium]|nr:hypothetical protein [SAR324 cluster bacterium]
MKKRTAKTIFLIFVLSELTGTVLSVSAQEVLSVSRSYRSLALGQTGIASANDSAALFYNPAILANVKGWWLDYSAWTLEGSDGISAAEAAPMMITPIFPYINRDGISDSDKSSFLSKENPYLRGNAGVNLTMNLTDKGISVAASYLIEKIATLTNNGASIYQRDDTIQKGGVSIPLGQGSLVLGLATTRIERRVAADATTDTITHWGSRSTGTGYDIGLLYRMANKARITLGLVMQNYGGIDFGDAALTEDQHIGFGISMNHELGIFKIVPAIDIRNISADTAQKNTLHAGLEIGMFPNSTGGSYLTYRAGTNQGYMTQGVELNLLNHYMIIGYTLYGEEVGEGSEKLESRRAVAYFSLGF